MYDVKIFATDLEDKALDQINTLAAQASFAGQKIRIMPDVHAGMGCVIGFTSTMGDYVIPNVVGVDIGCGMLTLPLGKMDIDLPKFDNQVKRSVPAGAGFYHKEDKYTFPRLAELRCYDKIATQNAARMLGTLGSGNHFIELDKDTNNEIYLVIHTGSRNIGKQVCDYYQKLAIANLKGSDIPRDLCYLTGRDKDDYLHDMKIAQEYATVNRWAIATQILENYFHPAQVSLSDDFALKIEGILESQGFETVHNYIDFEQFIIRKGAISAQAGERVLIPMNMRDGAIIAVAKGTEDTNFSLPHGAGRTKSRTGAKASITLDEFKQSMAGIYTTTANISTIDEAPHAYKSIESILPFVEENAKIEHIIRPIYNFKAAEDRSMGKRRR